MKICLHVILKTAESVLHDVVEFESLVWYMFLKFFSGYKSKWQQKPKTSGRPCPPSCGKVPPLLWLQGKVAGDASALAAWLGMGVSHLVVEIYSPCREAAQLCRCQLAKQVCEILIFNPTGAEWKVSNALCCIGFWRFHVLCWCEEIMLNVHGPLIAT